MIDCKLCKKFYILYMLRITWQTVANTVCCSSGTHLFPPTCVHLEKVCAPMVNKWVYKGLNLVSMQLVLVVECFLVWGYTRTCASVSIYIYMKIRRRERTSLAGCPVRGCPLCNLLPALLQQWLEVLAVSYTYTLTQIRHHSPFQSLGPCTARATWNELDNQPMVTLCRSKHTHVSSQQRF